MIRAVSLLFGLLAIAALFSVHFNEQISLAETLLGILAIIGFAVIATGWTIDHDV